jgi:two-component system sensor histidine kinase KdpD
VRPVQVELPDEVPAVLVDPMLADEALANLVENVIRHAPSDARLRFTARLAADGRAELTIEDSGPGVLPDEMPHLFDKFYRSPRRSRTTRGTGLGLSVTRGLIQAMGGSVSAEHSELGGLAVHLLLPAAPDGDDR